MPCDLSGYQTYGPLEVFHEGYGFGDQRPKILRTCSGRTKYRPKGLYYMNGMGLGTRVLEYWVLGLCVIDIISACNIDGYQNYGPFWFLVLGYRIFEVYDI